MSLTVGQISYLNCAPFFHYLPQTGFAGRLVKGVPSHLNRLLHEGQIDICPSSSFEYATHWRDYLLLPGFSISSRGPVQSVLLFSPCAIEDLAGHDIALTGESATSVNLLRILFWEFYNVHGTKLHVPQGQVEDLIAQGQPALLIGDRALRGARRFADSCHIYDLGQLWYEQTGLPFVFALWILRREVASKKQQQLMTLVDQLEQSLQMAFASLDVLAQSVPESAWLDASEISTYWRCMSYGLDCEHREGVRLFFRLCHAHGLLAEGPKLHFWETS
jgi:chorismate dehydratase